MEGRPGDWGVSRVLQTGVTSWTGDLFKQEQPRLVRRAGAMLPPPPEPQGLYCLSGRASRRLWGKQEETIVWHF